jgi:uroporphyrinogen III methyltransferase/synthase
MLRADIARPMLNEKLTEAGASVADLTIYQTKTAASLPEKVARALRDYRIDYVTFTSSSTVRNFVQMLGDASLLDGVKLASIGPITSKTAIELGLTLSVEATRYDIDGLIEAIVASEQA